MNRKTKTLKVSAILIILILQISPKVIAQACGGGILNFNIYTLNGNAVNDFDYEILPISEELAKKFNYQDIWGSGGIVNGITNSIIDNKNETLNNKLKKWLALSKIPSKGKIKSSINFKTFETVYFPIVLKITQNKKTIYIIGNYFGGCTRHVSLIWSDKYDISIQ